MSRRKKYEPKGIESIKGVGDTSANIYRSMMLHPACMDLTGNQFRLYVYCKSEYYGKGRHDLDGFPEHIRKDPAYFTFNKAKWIKGGLYGLYSNPGQFYKDLAALIEHGFVDCIQSGFNTRTRSLYRFSDRWQLWGTDGFSVPANVMNVSMLRKYYGNNGASDDENI